MQSTWAGAAAPVKAPPLAATPEPTRHVELSADTRAIAHGLFLDTPVSDEAIEHSAWILAGLRRYYGSRGGVRDDEQLARRALDEVESIEFTDDDRARMAHWLDLSLDPAACRDACDNLRRFVTLRLRMEALEWLAERGHASVRESDRPAR